MNYTPTSDWSNSGTVVVYVSLTSVTGVLVVQWLCMCLSPL